MTSLESDDPPIREIMNIKIELYDDFSLAMWEQRPGSCGTGAAPILAVRDLLDSIEHEYEELSVSPEEQCHQSLNDLRLVVNKFFEGLPRSEK